LYIAIGFTCAVLSIVQLYNSSILVAGMQTYLFSRSGARERWMKLTTQSYIR